MSRGIKYFVQNKAANKNTVQMNSKTSLHSATLAKGASRFLTMASNKDNFIRKSKFKRQLKTTKYHRLSECPRLHAG